MKIAVIPGSFDPITKGHESVIRRSLPLFDKIVIGIGNNSTKKYCFPLVKRMDWIKEVFKKEKKVTVETYSGLTVDFCRKVNAGYILRGLRTSADFEFERTIALMNRSMNSDIETIFMVSLPEFSSIASSIVREIYLNGGDVSRFVPAAIHSSLVS